MKFGTALATTLIGLGLAMPAALAQTAQGTPPSGDTGTATSGTAQPSDTGAPPPAAHHHARAAHGSRASADNSADDLNAKSLADARSNTTYTPASTGSGQSGSGGTSQASSTSSSGTTTHNRHHHGAASGSPGDSTAASSGTEPSKPTAPSGGGAGNTPQ